MRVWVYLALISGAFVATSVTLRGEEGYKHQEHKIKQQLRAFNWNGFFGRSTNFQEWLVEQASNTPV